MNNGRNSHERHAITVARKLLLGPENSSRHYQEQMINQFVMHIVNAAAAKAKAQIEAEQRREERQEEAIEYVRKRHWK